MGFSQQEYLSRLAFPTPGDLPDPGIKSGVPESPALAGRFFTIVPRCQIQVQRTTSAPNPCPVENSWFTEIQALPWGLKREALTADPLTSTRSYPLGPALSQYTASVLSVPLLPFNSPLGMHRPLPGLWCILCQHPTVSWIDFILLAALQGLWDFSSLTRVQTPGLGIKNTES